MRWRFFAGPRSCVWNGRQVNHYISTIYIDIETPFISWYQSHCQSFRMGSFDYNKVQYIFHYYVTFFRLLPIPSHATYLGRHHSDARILKTYAYASVSVHKKILSYKLGVANPFRVERFLFSSLLQECLVPASKVAFLLRVGYQCVFENLGLNTSRCTIRLPATALFALRRWNGSS